MAPPPASSTKTTFLFHVLPIFEQNTNLRDWNILPNTVNIDINVIDSHEYKKNTEYDEVQPNTQYFWK